MIKLLLELAMVYLNWPGHLHVMWVGLTDIIRWVVVKSAVKSTIGKIFHYLVSWPKIS